MIPLSEKDRYGRQSREHNGGFHRLSVFCFHGVDFNFPGSSNMQKQLTQLQRYCWICVIENPMLKGGESSQLYETKNLSVDLLNRKCKEQTHWGFEVLAKVEQWLPIAQSIRNIIPTTLAMLKPSRTSEIDPPNHCWWKYRFPDYSSRFPNHLHR